MREVLTEPRTLRAKNMAEEDAASDESSWSTGTPRSYVSQ